MGDFLKKNGYGQLWWINWQSIRPWIQWNRVRILIRGLKIKQIFGSDESKLGVLDIKYPNFRNIGLLLPNKLGLPPEKK